MIKHASIVPLIGGETIAQQNIFGSKPEYILSYSVFQNNESHLLNYYNNEIPYHLLDDKGSQSKLKLLEKVNVVNTVCPCAGLSSLSPSANSNSAMNEWMFRSAEYVLSNIKPEVFWGENAPRLASKMGEPVVKRLRKIGEENGYTMSIFKTKSILHGLSQVRDRTFYFFWKGDSIPLFEYVDNLETHEKIEDTILNARKGTKENDPMSKILTNAKIPSKDPFYCYLLEVIHGGISHAEYVKKIEKSGNVLDFIEMAGHTYKDVAKWMRAHGFDREAKKSDRMYHKLKGGGNIMRKHVEIPKNYIGAFVGHMPGMLTHPTEDRFLTVRECLAIMKMPADYELLNPSRSLNHICQNVPVTTAMYAAQMVKDHLEGKLETVKSKFLIQDNKSKSINISTVNSLGSFFSLHSQQTVV